MNYKLNCCGAILDGKASDLLTVSGNPCPACGAADYQSVGTDDPAEWTLCTDKDGWHYIGRS